jgi:hypothetical protein
MRNPHLFLALFLTACGFVVEAQDPRISLFDRYNHARTYDEIKPLVSGVLAQTVETVVSRDAQRLPQILAGQRLTSYRPRIVEIDDATSFLVLENITSDSFRDMSPQAYVLSKGPNGAWTLANRLMPDSVLKTLWTTRFTPAQFVQPSSCAIDGRDIRMQSAVAVRQGDTIQVTLYPFAFSQADLDYWRQVSGLTVKEDSVAASHFNGARTAVCRLVVKIDKTNRLSLLNVGFDDPPGRGARSTLWQPSKAVASTVVLQHDALDVITAGAIGTDKNDFRWNVSITVPLWERGL